MSQQFDPREPYNVPVFNPASQQFEEQPVSGRELQALNALEESNLKRQHMLLTEGEITKLINVELNTYEAIRQIQSTILGISKQRTLTAEQETAAQIRARDELARRAEAEDAVSVIIQKRGKDVERELKALGEIENGLMRVSLGGRTQTVRQGEIRQAFDRMGTGNQTQRDVEIHHAVQQALIRRELTSGAISRQQHEASVGDTMGRLWAGVRTGRGLSFGDLAGSVKGVGLGPIGIALAAVTALPQIMHTFERTWNNTVGMPVRQWQESTRLGQITGEGWRAGAGMRFAATRQGLNPFDMVSRQMAMEIQQGLAQQGFRGEVRDALSETVIGAVNDLGLEHAEVINLVTTAYRRNGMTLEQIEVQLERLDDLAKGMGRSIQDTAKIWGTLNEMLTAGGAGRGAASLATTLTAGFPQPITNEQIQGLLADPNIMAMAGSYAGVPPHLLMLPENQGRLPGALQRAVSFWLQQSPGRTMREKAAMLRTVVPAFATWGVPEILALANAEQGGAGFAAQQRFTQAEQFFRSSTRFREDQFTTLRHEPRGFGMERVGEVPLDVVARTRRNTLNKLRDVLTPQEIKRFEENINNRDFDVSKFIAEARQVNRMKVGEKIEKDTVTIQLSQEGKRFFKLHGREAEANNRGLLPGYDLYGSGQSRTWGRE